MEKQPGIGVLKEFRIEFMDCWKRLPDKGFFLCLLAAWLALFHFLGSSTLGYIRTPSLFYWLFDAYGGRTEHPLESDAAYGFLVPLAVALLFWLKRRELLAVNLRPWGPGLLLVGAGLALHILGYMVQQPRISVLALFTGLYGLTGLVWGPGWLRTSFFPFFLFVLCIPLGSLAEPITFRLRLLVSALVGWVCHFILAIDIVQSGNNLMDPSGRYSYEVAAACSGLRSQIAILGLAIAVAFFFFRSWWRRLVLIAAAFPLAVLGNLLRLLAIIIAAELGGQSWGKWVDDGGPLGLISLLPYLPAFAGLFALDYWLRERPASSLEQPGPKEVQSS
jgi:exosortase